MPKANVALPPPSPAAMSTAESAGLGMFRGTIPVPKPRIFRGITIAGYAHEFEYGFIWLPEGDGPEPYRWNQIATVNWHASRNYVNGRYMGTAFWLILVSTDGRNMKLSGSCKDPAAKGGRNADQNAPAYLLYQFLIRARDTVSIIQLPDAITALNRGEQLTFGDLQIDSTGIQTPKGSVPWSSIKAVSIHQGRVSVRQEGKFFALSSVGAEKIPNCPLFLSLAQMLTRKAASDGTILV